MSNVLTKPDAAVEHFHQQGYWVERSVFTPTEVESILAHFEHLHAHAPRDRYNPMTPEQAGGDPLKIRPRMMHPHRFDDHARNLLLDPRVLDRLQSFLGEPPIAAQSMFYFKPPGARGQAFHQDNFYLNVRPGTCIAAWMALDPSTPENGGLSVFPYTQDLAIACPERADERQSFATEYVAPPEGAQPVGLRLNPGDVLYFNGNVIHGSGPNQSNQFRRSYICHYMAESDTAIAQYYHPLLNRRGEVVSREAITLDGRSAWCGTDFDPTTTG